MTSVSVVIPTHNPKRKFFLRVLDSLKKQTLDQSGWELLVVDNNSAEKVSETYDLSWHSSAKHISENRIGLTNARLRGIRESIGEIIVFVDDDTLLAPDYLEKAKLIAKEWPFIGAWGGSVFPEFEIPPPAWTKNDIWRLTIVDVQRDIWSNIYKDFETVPVGAGMCIRKCVAEYYLQRCDNSAYASLDRSGTFLAGYGDVDLALCAVDLGLGTGRSTKLSLRHLIPSSRLTIEYFTRHAEGDAASLLVFRAMRGLSLKYDGKPGFLKQLSIRFYYLRNKISKEGKLIHQAHMRGLEMGYQTVLRLSKKDF
jgi:glycosyltransferase involved in cell wall biosynthesis